MDENLLKAATENFNLPHDVVPLPSGGIFYKSKKKSIKVGYLTANDENTLISAAQNPNQNVVMSLLRNKVYEHDLRPEELLETDVEAVLIFLRNTSFGPEYEIQLIDPKTQTPFTTNVMLDEMNITKTEFQPDENGLFMTKLPRSGVMVKLKPLTYNDIIELEKMKDQYPPGLVAPVITWRLNKMIVEIDGVMDKEKIVTTVRNLPIMDSKYIKTFLKNNIPSLDLKKRTIAPSGEEVIFDITFGVEFFRPFF